MIRPGPGPGTRREEFLVVGPCGHDGVGCGHLLQASVGGGDSATRGLGEEADVEQNWWATQAEV